ncbi:DUF6402 family protein [Paraburkholderia nemoris]|uniref:DUF6402 family protein n=1 Tax=Paraburkholderia nemoris TaxID=2793076 RepID=UPI0038B993FE
MPSTYYKKIPYYKINKILWRWKRCDAENGCYIIPSLAISMNKAPPPPQDQPPRSPPPPKPPRQKKEVGEGLLAILEAQARFRKWLDTPSPPKPPKAAPTEKTEVVPPFDLQEIPGAMRKEFMPVSAKLMERWFAGALNYSPTTDDEKAGINQNSEPYPASMIDTTTIKLDWILKFPRAKAQYDFLVNSAIRAPKAVDMIGQKLKPLRAPSGRVDGLATSAKVLPTLHKHFQFQFAGVESSISQKFDQFIVSERDNGGVPDDLTGSLGSFNFYAAIGNATFDLDARHATVTSIVVYVKDNYTFTDDTGKPSQYLGHWSRDGVIIVPATAAAGIADIAWIDYPVAVGNVRVPGNVHYPVRNRSFRQWQLMHQRGGDFIVYSDYRVIGLNPPIELGFL